MYIIVFLLSPVLWAWAMLIRFVLWLFKIFVWVCTKGFVLILKIAWMPFKFIGKLFTRTKKTEVSK